jgi:recombination protein RecR
MATVDPKSIFSKPVARLIAAFHLLPGIGPKNAQRLAVHVIKRLSDQQFEELMEALRDARKNTHTCGLCAHYSTGDRCVICANPKRDAKIICIVQTSEHLAAIEKSGVYKGVYHVLDGLISPMDGVTPEHLTLNLLQRRVHAFGANELIVALPSSVPGEHTSLYIAALLRATVPKITQLSRGLAAEADLDYVDAKTVAESMRNRQPLDPFGADKEMDDSAVDY